jgi:hypothetical protein
MITKEQIGELTAKWTFLLSDLKKPKHVQYKFARVYEKIVENNHPKNTKMLLAVAHRVFAKSDENLKSTKSSKNKKLLTEYNEEDIYEGYTINVQKAISFADALADMTIDEIKKQGRFSYLQIEDNKIYFIY